MGIPADSTCIEGKVVWGGGGGVGPSEWDLLRPLAE